MENRYLKSVLLICLTLLLCSCEQQVDDIVDNVQKISGPSCCTVSHNVKWNLNTVTLSDAGSKISFVSRLNGTLNFYYKSYSSTNILVIRKNGDAIFNDYNNYGESVVIRNVRKGDKFTFVNKDPNFYYHDRDITLDNIKIIGSNYSNSNDPDWDF